jgi:hypothetical protein
MNHVPTIGIFGVIQNPSCTKVQEPLLNTWSAFVQVEFVPALGETVATLEHQPYAKIKAGATVLAQIDLTKGSGNTYSGVAAFLTTEPTSVTFGCRFVSDIVEATCNCLAP